MRHLTPERIQEFLDQELTPRDAALVQEHLDVCVQCRSEVEGWGLLFSDLGHLPELRPGPAFRQEVLEGTPMPQPVAQRPWGWLAAREARKREEAHVPAGSIQDYLEGLLAPQPAARVEAHLASCDSCQAEVQEWTVLLERFRPLRHLAPRPGFSERVMAQVMVPAPVPVRGGRWSAAPGRALAWIRSLLPKTRHGWAVAGGMASAPTITMAALVYLLFSRPLLTPGAFGSYFLWKASDLFASVINGISSWAVGNPLVLQAYARVESLIGDPLILGVGGLLFSLFSAAALWVLYKNLIVTQSDDRYARVRV